MKQLVICIDLEQDDIMSSASALLTWEGAQRALQWRWTLPWDGAAVNWFVRTDVQTTAVLGDAAWPLRHLEAGLRRAVDAGDTVGAHPHLYRECEGGWRNDFSDAEFSWRCAEIALDAHLAVFGEPCRIWRWGDRAGQLSLRPRLAAAGVHVDATVEPEGPAISPRDDGSGRTPSYVGHDSEPRCVDGLVDWPLTTMAPARATSLTTGVHAALPVGSLDVITDHFVQGWCCDASPGAEDTVVDVELLVHGEVVAVTAADWHRPDVAAAGYGEGRHGARVGMRDEWRALPVEAFVLRAAGHDRALHGAPSDVRAPLGSCSTVIPLPLQTEPEQFARMLDVLLRDDTSHVTLAMRSEVFLDPVLVAMIDRNCVTLAAHAATGTLSAPQSLLSLAAALLLT